MLAMFGMVITQGMGMLVPVMNESAENAMIAAVAVSLGVGVSVVPGIFDALPESVSLLTSNGIVCGSVTAIILNILFNMIGPKHKKTRCMGKCKEKLNNIHLNTPHILMKRTLSPTFIY